MSTLLRIAGYEAKDVIRGKWITGYALLLLLLTEGLFRFGGDSARVLLSLVNVVLLLVPLLGLAFGTVYLYGAREFTEMLLAQPVGRGSLFGGLFAGLAAPLVGALILGVGLPFAVRGGIGGGEGKVLVLLLATGSLLSLVFVALAFVLAIRIHDRLRGLGAALLLWLSVAVLYDALVLVGITVFSAYPLERPLLVLMFLNPVDLARVLLLLQMDIAALMGYTGAVFERFFGTGSGMGLAAGALAAWVVFPLGAALALFHRKDF